MTEFELNDLLVKIQKQKAESNILEVKSASAGTPERLYDTLSAFSNQDDGGIIVFGVDEDDAFSEVGVYDAQDLQQHVVEQCNQMEPKVRPVFTVASKDGKTFVSAEIPGMDIADRPCFYQGKGRLKGSYVRVGDADEPMTEYEVYSYEAYRKKYQDDIRTVDGATLDFLDQMQLQDYLLKVKNERPNFSSLSLEDMYKFTGLIKNNALTLAAIMLLGTFPQAYFPQLCITAISVPGNEVGEVGAEGYRFIDNKRIDGTIIQMLDEALMFVRKNMKVKTTIVDGNRIDKTEYPINAVREAILNALVHRDYSIHTEGQPIQLIMYRNRLEIKNPGGLYGRFRIDQLGKVQPDTRNPTLAVAMEVLKKTENRYSGIPTIRREMKEWGLPEPEFEVKHGSFCVRFYNESVKANDSKPETMDILEFCSVARTRQEIANFLGIKTVAFAIKTYIMPLVEQGLIELVFPEKPRSCYQMYKTK